MIAPIAMLGFAMGADAQIASPRVATILHVEGNARYSIDNQTWQPLKKGAAFNLGAIIQTADKARVDILLDDPTAADQNAGFTGGGASGDNPVANVVRVLPNTVLAVDKLTAIRYDSLEEVQLDLRTGQILASARKLTGTAKYEVKVSNGVVGVRSGHFKIQANGTVDVYSGSVIVAESVGDGTLTTKLVEAGKRFDPASNSLVDAPPLDKKESSPIREGRDSNRPPQRMVPDITGGFRKY